MSKTELIDWESLINEAKKAQEEFEKLPRLKQIEIEIKLNAKNIMACMFSGDWIGEKECLDREQALYAEKNEILKEVAD